MVLTAPGCARCEPLLREVESAARDREVVRVDLATRRFYLKGHFLYAIAGSATFECRREALQEGNVPG